MIRLPRGDNKPWEDKRPALVASEARKDAGHNEEIRIDRARSDQDEHQWEVTVRRTSQAVKSLVSESGRHDLIAFLSGQL